MTPTDAKAAPARAGTSRKVAAPEKATKQTEETTSTPEPEGARDTYTLPLVHVEVPGYVVEGGFWGGLAGAAVVGMINPPLAVALGAGVVIARHRRAA